MHPLQIFNLSGYCGNFLSANALFIWKVSFSKAVTKKFIKNIIVLSQHISIIDPLHFSSRLRLLLLRSYPICADNNNEYIDADVFDLRYKKLNVKWKSNLVKTNIDKENMLLTTSSLLLRQIDEFASWSDHQLMFKSYIYRSCTVHMSSVLFESVVREVILWKGLKIVGSEWKVIMISISRAIVALALACSISTIV